MDFVKLAHAKFYKLYCDPYAKFEDQIFDNFHFIGTLTSATYPMSWFSDRNGGEDAEYFVFSFVGGKYPFYHFVVGVKGLQPITKATLQQSINKVKEECEGIVQSLVLKLKCYFFAHEVMTTLGVIYLEFWTKNPTNLEECFHIHLGVLNKFSMCFMRWMIVANVCLFYCQLKILIVKKTFKVAMVHNVGPFLREGNKLDPIIKL